MKLSDALILVAKAEEEVQELHDLKPGVQKVLPGLLQTRIHGTKWRVGLVLEKVEE